MFLSIVFLINILYIFILDYNTVTVRLDLSASVGDCGGGVGGVGGVSDDCSDVSEIFSDKRFVEGKRVRLFHWSVFGEPLFCDV